MPRRARLSVPGIPWHIIQRGNNRATCFHSDRDYLRYIDDLTEQSKRFDCAIHAYVLMSNHVHLLLTPRQHSSAALFMRNVGQRYAQYVNRVYQRTGTLWEGRFRSCLTQSERYVLACYRYIEMNPVRACIAHHPRDYRWSSYRANGIGRLDSLITPHPLYMALAHDDTARRAAYRALCGDGLEPDMIERIRAATHSNVVLGDEHFTQQIARTLERRVTPGKAGRPRLARDDPEQGTLV
jgi:putative transposase